MVQPIFLFYFQVPLNYEIGPESKARNLEGEPLTAFSGGKGRLAPSPTNLSFAPKTRIRFFSFLESTSRESFKVK
jgi:hypothetical protein